ncbi:TPA: response regulator transcription factor [Enterobacter kobei]|uniref:response regulator transcription factor n=1 Tax=Enterobacter TaxID=547 RepID=UPI000B55D74B|nr:MULTISPECIES: response regulator transcription factor [Enterobacter]EHN8793088.1 response regulator transcription factor [Enterobacter kobei]ELE9693341.1 response regulator transcription factor [Enterobacter kobei]ELE9726429.1 response regulator transcription factor [Enterobacter kobei]ELJ5853556.1 response regulator transcription factor [Enterobacter kobei]MBO4152374.1 response regulator transcription factor [Enterobacter kobei]
MSTIFIVDDHPVSQLAVQVVANGKGYDVVGTCDNGHDALVYLRNHRPDLVVIDIDIPPPDGLEVIKRLREENYPGGIIVLTTHSDQHFVDRVRAAGANGFISKNNQLDALADAFRAVLNGYEFFPQRQSSSGRPDGIQPEKDLLSRLSNRELQVLGYIARGELLVEIAEKLHVSNKSVSTYKRRIMEKLGLSKTLELVEFAKRNHLA